MNGGDDVDTVDDRSVNHLLLSGSIDRSTGTTDMGGGTDQRARVGIAWVTGSESRDTIIGPDLVNQLDGQRSNDSITGDLGNDTLDGGGDIDSIMGGNRRWIVAAHDSSLLALPSFWPLP